MHADLFIGGRWVSAADGRTVEIRDPATGDLVGRAALGGVEDARTALAAAQAAFGGWSRTPALERAAILRAAASLVRGRIDEIARVLTLEQGKPLTDARKEIAFACDVFDYYAEEGQRISGEWRPARDSRIRSLVLHQPIGVVVAIMPWNYPIDLLSWKIGPALAAGCTVVAKPATETPLSTAMVVGCFEEAGLPGGALNLVIGRGGEVGDELVRNPISRLITITASTQTGRHVMHLAANGIKRLTLELGGQTPLIVLDDVDLAMVVPAAVRRSYSNMGQICIAVNRIFVANSVGDAFTEAFAEQAASVRLGHGLDEGVEYGPLLNEETRQRAVAHVADAVRRGARLVVGGRAPQGEAFARGTFYLPTVLTDVDTESLVMREETFGPVAAIRRYASLDEAIVMANDSPYGLAAYVFGRDLERCLYVAERLEAGGVGVNVNDVTELSAPFGGWKQSGFGRELGPEGLAHCLELKHVRIGLTAAEA
ncbi:MAG: NAD-dependent succinate-semialdehyde dehydrogenase [Anaerolinea sp.]|nr:NAD-dependent succinate-semialdehyde dehydrogenase [Anaerolinea sp.]